MSSHTPRHVRLRALAALVLLLMVATACGGSGQAAEEEATDAADTAATTSDDPAVDATDDATPVDGQTDIATSIETLVADAVAAGQTTVTISASDTSAAVYEELEAAFEADYPDIDMQVRNLPAFQAGAIIASELQSGQETVDLIATSLLILQPLVDIDALDLGVPWTDYGVPEARIGALGLPLFTDATCGDILYNTDVVDAADLPDTLEGLASEEFSGMMVTLPNNAPACLAFYGLMFGEQEALELGLTLRDDYDMLLSENAESLLLSGERPILPLHYSIPVGRLIAEGAPVARKLYPGIGVFRNRLAVLTDSAAPDAARALALWMVSDGQQVWDEFYQGGYGFLGDDGNPSLLRQRLIDDGYDPDDDSYFVFETGENWMERARLANAFAEALAG